MNPEDKELEEKVLRSLFFDIYRGCSEVSIKVPKDSTFFDEDNQEISCYAKHFNFFDQLDVDKHYETSLSKAKKKGLPTRKENLKRLEDSGDWTNKDEMNWLNKKSYVESLKKTQSKMVIPTQIEGIQKQIDEVAQEVAALDSERSSLVGQTCETYASKSLNVYTIYKSLYKDEETKEFLFKEEEMEYLDNYDLSILIGGYNSAVKNLELSQIKKMAISGFFTSYYGLDENHPLSVFNKKSIIDLSFYQLNLLSYSKVLRSIIRNLDPPKELFEDPDKLIEWSEKGEKQRKLMDKAQDTDKDFSVVGAKQKDYDAIGDKRTGDSIFDLAKKKGGELDIMDFLNEQ